MQVTMKHPIWPLGIALVSKISRRPLTVELRTRTFEFARRMHTTDSTVSDRSSNSYCDALEILSAGIAAVNPAAAIAAHLSIDPTNTNVLQLRDPTAGKTHRYASSDYDSFILVAFGKAAPAMTMESLRILSSCFHNVPFVGCVVVTKDFHISDEQRREIHKLCSTWRDFDSENHLHILESAHPIPDQRSVDAAQLILNLVQKHASPKTLILCCISGGGSSLVTAPIDSSSLTLQDLQQTNSALLASGMDIAQINMFRKKLDAIKGGKLAEKAYPSTLLSLLLSDVIGDDLASIASGPTVPLHGYASSQHPPCVQEMITQYHLTQTLSPTVLHALFKDQDNSQHPIFNSKLRPETHLSETVVVGNNHLALVAAAATAKTLGYHPIILGSTIQGEAKVIAAMYISMAEYLIQQGKRKDEINHYYSMTSQFPIALLAGGETTVTLDANHATTGKMGGRNQELALAAALLLQKSKYLESPDDIVLGSLGTDGTDGPTDAAGSIVDGNTVHSIETMNGGRILAKDALRDHDSYNFFNSVYKEDKSSVPNALIKTGPTGTNVADICVILIRSSGLR